MSNASWVFSLSCQTIITPHSLLVSYKFVESHYCLSRSPNHQTTIFSPRHLLQLRCLITERVAVKIIDKGKLDSKTHRMVSREIQITDALSHPHLIRFVSQLLRNVIYVMKFLLTFFYPISTFHANRYTENVINYYYWILYNSTFRVIQVIAR